MAFRWQKGYFHGENRVVSSQLAGASILKSLSTWTKRWPLADKQNLGRYVGFDYIKSQKQESLALLLTTSTKY